MPPEGGDISIGEPGSQSATVSMVTPVIENNDKSTFVIPDEYKDRGYLKDVQNYNDIFKKLDGAQSLLGKTKPNFPTDQTSEEDLLSFNRSAGMPEKAEEYVFNKIGDTERNIDFDSKIKDIFHEAGISGKAATKIQTKYETVLEETLKNQQIANDAAFDELTSKILGERKTEILASSKELLTESIPEGLEESVKNLNNEALVTMAVILNNFKTKYIDEDNINDQNLNTGNSGMDDLRKKGRELLGHPARNDAFHPDHKRINEELTEVYTQIGKAS